METNARYMTVGIAVLAIVAAVFGFVYWLNNDVGLGARTLYRIRFENSVSGLQVGSAVQFNGIRVGEVDEPATRQRRSSRDHRRHRGGQRHSAASRTPRSAIVSRA